MMALISFGRRVALALSIAVFYLLLDRAEAFPSGAGSCVSGLPVGGPHLAEPNLNTLAAIDIQVEVGGQVLTPGSTLALTTGSYDVMVTRSSGTFRGVLIRAESDDGSIIDFEPTDNLLAPSTFCSAPVVGLTHTSSNNKSQVSGSLTLDSPSRLSLQVTVVLFADGSGPSSHAYDAMSIEFTASSPPPPPTDAPVVAPTESPVDPPTDAPVPAPTEEPTSEPTPSPTTRAPTDAPTLSPTKSPVVAPTEMPVDAPVPAPTEAPVATPNPTDAPVSAPTEAPVVVPSPTDPPVTPSPTTMPVSPPVDPPTERPVEPTPVVERCSVRARARV